MRNAPLGQPDHVIDRRHRAGQQELANTFRFQVSGTRAARHPPKTLPGANSIGATDKTHDRADVDD
jgi:hypothetical protein